MRVHLIYQTGIHNPYMIYHALKWYQRYNFDTCNVILHSTPSDVDSELYNLCIDQIKEFQVDDLQLWHGQFSDKVKTSRRLKYCDIVDQGDWMVPCDGDEFIEFPTTNLHDWLPSRIMDKELAVVYGYLLDRTTRDKSLQPVLKSPCIFEQFPEGIPNNKFANTYAPGAKRGHKVVAFTKGLFLDNGHHNIRLEKWISSRCRGGDKKWKKKALKYYSRVFESYIGHSIHHFKWTDQLKNTLDGLGSHIAKRESICRLDNWINNSNE